MSQPRARPAWMRRAVISVVVAGAIVLAVLLGAAFVPRWWSHRIADQAQGNFTAGIWLGLFYGFVFTLVPLLVLRFAFRRRREVQTWGIWASSRSCSRLAEPVHARDRARQRRRGTRRRAHARRRGAGIPERHARGCGSRAARRPRPRVPARRPAEKPAPAGRAERGAPAAGTSRAARRTPRARRFAQVRAGFVPDRFVSVLSNRPKSVLRVPAVRKEPASTSRRNRGRDPKMRRKNRMFLFAPLAALSPGGDRRPGGGRRRRAAGRAAERGAADDLGHAPGGAGADDDQRPLDAVRSRSRTRIAWRRCDENGGSCSAIGGANEQTYKLKQPDVDNTIRVRVTAGTPTATPRRRPFRPPSCAPRPRRRRRPGATATRRSRSRTSTCRTGCSWTARGSARRSSAARHRRSRSAPTSRARARPCRARASTSRRSLQPVHVAEATTGADGWASVTMTQLSGFPAANSQQLLTVFIRAQKGPGTELGGISTRRLVSFPVDLRR